MAPGLSTFFVIAVLFAPPNVSTSPFGYEHAADEQFSAT
jgi:hypothetical protein